MRKDCFLTELQQGHANPKFVSLKVLTLKPVQDRFLFSCSLPLPSAVSHIQGNTGFQTATWVGHTPLTPNIQNSPEYRVEVTWSGHSVHLSASGHLNPMKQASKHSRYSHMGFTTHPQCDLVPKYQCRKTCNHDLTPFNKKFKKLKGGEVEDILEGGCRIPPRVHRKSCRSQASSWALGTRTGD